MATRWLYTVAGQPAYYQEGEYIYSKSGTCEFAVSNGWWYPIKGGAGAYYESNGWIYTSDGKSAFNLGDADKIRPLKASPLRAFIVAFIVFSLTCGISILVLGRFGMSDNQSRPPSTAAETTFTVGTLTAFAIAASHWLPQPGW